MMENAFWNEKIGMPYVKDVSNSFGLSVLYFLSYFLSYYFPSLFDKWVKREVEMDEEKREEKEEAVFSPDVSKKASVGLGIFLFVLGVGIGFWFCHTAMKNGDKIWINHLSYMGKLYYCLFLGLTWYHSLSALAMALMASGIIFWCIKEGKLVYEREDYNRNVSIVDAVNVVICIFSYGIFYIVVYIPLQELINFMKREKDSLLV